MQHPTPSSKLRLNQLFLALVHGLCAVLIGCSPNEAPPESTPVLTREELLEPETCQSCHPIHYDQWSGSMHAYAALDPVFLAMNQRGQEETNGALGDFCVNCHAPIAVREGLTTDGLNLAELPDYSKGVTCYFCHNVESVDGTHNNPLRLANSKVMYGGILDPTPTPAHDSAFSEIMASGTRMDGQLCGPCHDIVTPPPTMLELERTFSEWQETVFTKEGCSGCHMGEQKRVAVAVGERTDRELHGHQFAAVDVALTPFPLTDDPVSDAAIADEQRALIQDLLDLTLRVDICVQRNINSAYIHITLDNFFAGHNFPSGATHDRRVWVEVEAFSGDQEAPIYQSGIIGPDEAVSDSTDPDIWLLHDKALGADGETAHMFWDIQTMQRRTIPGAITNIRDSNDFLRTHVTRRFPRGNVGISPLPDKVTVLVRMRPMGFDVLDDLIESGHLDAQIKDRMPTFDLIPNRHLANHPTLSGFSTKSFEWSQAVKDSTLFDNWIDNTSKQAKDCVGEERKP